MIIIMILSVILIVVLIMITIQAYNFQGYQGGLEGYLGRLVPLKLSFLILFMALASSSWAQGARIVSPVEARDFLPHLEQFALPASQNMIAISQDPLIWPQNPEGQRDRLMALAYSNIQTTLLQELIRRTQAAIDQNHEHDFEEFLFLGKWAQLAGQEAAKKTGSVEEKHRLAWFASTVIADFSFDGVKQIIQAHRVTPSSDTVSPEFARRLEAQWHQVVARYRDAEALAASRENMLAGRYVDPLRQVGTSAMGLSADKIEEGMDHLRLLALEEVVSLDSLRRATTVAASYSSIGQALSLLLLADPQLEFGQNLGQAEDVLLETMLALEDYQRSKGQTERSCDNQIDDDQDDATDCEDFDCDNAMVCCRNCI